MTFSTHHWPSKVANILVYLTLVSGNLYSTFIGGEDQDSPYHSKHQSYITPAAFTFYIWTLIHVLLGGMVIYQWFNDKVHKAVGWHFVIVSIINAIWLALWTAGHTFLAFVTLIFATGAVSFIYYRLKEQHAADTVAEVLFLHLPFSLYHAWIFVLLVINAFAVFSSAEGEPSTFQAVLAIVGLVFVASTVIGYIEYKKGDVAGALVLSWYLFGVFAQQKDAAIHWTSLGLGIAVAVYTLKPFVTSFFGRQSGETAPLLG
ncbi:hypothetical protein BC939DRAFT_482881 [Gamsiella multidivaricata]|uniref:uncharacterized protein n=1 Tax=Gamsiella multidivaricata TaxID=101098 RepID=UPI002220BAA3|nr:uncharacterized protein BC939DRAFT_482881 [Gamsiella multidivaricata]KAG0364858.1 hypothetical protein BGZ54_007095 [Gamsiella multidivaricata]KAI7831392.1 hypothetical protein BC939DRAFT_482881 [Gamsiella multidivaricata]